MIYHEWCKMRSANSKKFKNYTIFPKQEKNRNCHVSFQLKYDPYIFLL